MTPSYLRIGELSARVGVSPELLRAWERRYGLVRPQRSDGGFRLYSDDDVARVRMMLRFIDRGASAAEAARLATSGTADQPAGPVTEGPEAPVDSSELADALRARLERFDGAGAHRLLDEALATFSVEAVIRDVVMPCLSDIGHRWQTGRMSVGQEHFASNLLRSRVLALARGWDQGVGPAAVLATPPGELHDVGLVAFGVVLYRQGLRVVFLGASCPIETIVSTAKTIDPAGVVVSAVSSEMLAAVGVELREVSRLCPLYIAGAGASAPLADSAGATYLGGDVVSSAAEVAAAATRRRRGFTAPHASS